jgi:hypothetical protein
MASGTCQNALLFYFLSTFSRATFSKSVHESEIDGNRKSAARLTNLWIGEKNH